MMFDIIMLSAITIIKQDGLFGMVYGNNNTITTTTVVYTLHGGEIFAITVTTSSLCNFPFLYIYPTTGRYNKPGQAQTALKLSYSFLFSCFLMFIYMQLVSCWGHHHHALHFLLQHLFLRLANYFYCALDLYFCGWQHQYFWVSNTMVLSFQNLSFCGCKIQI